jgi:hypothetical protein
MKNQYKEGFQILSNYLKDVYKVKTILRNNVDDAWYPELRNIFINKNYAWRERLIALLHESGHVQIDLDSISSKKMKISNVDFDYTSEYIRSKDQFVYLLNEELAAWNLGKKLVDSLGITIDEERFQFSITNCIMSYVKFGLKSVYKNSINIDSIFIK